MPRPRLEWWNAKGQFQSYPLKDREVIVGRDEVADITLPCDLVSRRHLKVFKTGSGYSIQDLGSTNGTFLNGQRLTQAKVLAHGDSITLADNQWTLHYQDAEDGQSIEDSNVTVFSADKETSQLVTVPVVVESRPAEISELDKVSFLLDLQSQWGNAFSPEKIFEHILKSALKISGAERGFILLRQGSGFTYASGIDSSGRQMSESEFQTSSSAVERVVAEGKPVFMTEGLDDAMAMQASIVAMNLRAVACLPLQGYSSSKEATDLRGILYLDSKRFMYALSGLDHKLLAKLAEEAGHVLAKVELIKSFEDRRKMEQELALAEETQRSLLPHTLPQVSNFRIRAFAKPTRYVGGDFYDFMLRGDGELVGVLGDVTGKGVPAALLSSMLLGCLDLQLRAGGDPCDALQRINETLCLKQASNCFTSLFLFTLDPVGRGQFVSAGHPPAYVYRKATRTLDDLQSTSMLMGAFSSVTFEAAPLAIYPGDILLVYSDGLTDAENPHGEMFGSTRTEEMIHAGASGGAEVLEQTMLGAIRLFTQDHPQTDDITLVIVERLA